MTKKQIEAKLPEGYGIDKAEGVWYFYGNDTMGWPDTCSNFCTLDQGTIEDWLNAFEVLKDRYEKTNKWRKGE